MMIINDRRNIPSKNCIKSNTNYVSFNSIKQLKTDLPYLFSQLTCAET